MYDRREEYMRKQKSKVRFSEHIEQIPLTTPTSECAAEGLTWLTYEDYVVIRQKAKMVEKDSRELGAGQLLNDRFREYPHHQQRSLNRWCRLSRRGLELKSNLEHGSRRDRERRNSIRCVLHSQKVQRNSGDIDPGHLAKVYSHLTQNAREFAVRMGTADACEAERCRLSMTQNSASKKAKEFQNRIASNAAVLKPVKNPAHSNSMLRSDKLNRGKLSTLDILPVIDERSFSGIENAIQDIEREPSESSVSHDEFPIAA